MIASPTTKNPEPRTLLHRTVNCRGARAKRLITKKAADTAASTTALIPCPPCCYSSVAIFRLAIVAPLMFYPSTLFGGVVLDGSFGTKGALPGPNYMISANFGKQVGTNLFQSFSQFNLTSSESATFTGPANIQNILSRVTDGNPSSIDGKISSQIQGANLFFLNPAGVMFGPNAQIDVTGSFAVSTANYAKMADGGRFNANLGGGDVLTSAPVSAFGFLNPTPAGVSVTGSTLNVAAKKSFSVIAGDIAIDGALISGQGSRVNLISVRSVGEAQLDPTAIDSAVDVSQFTTMGDIDLTNFASIDTSGAVGGPIVIRGGNLYLDNSRVTSETTGSTQGNPIDIVLLADLTILNQAFIFTNTLGSGNGGDINIRAKTLSIDGSAAPGQFTGIAAQTIGSATGSAGDLTITVDQALNVLGGGVISTDTFSGGNGGNLVIQAGSLTVDGSTGPAFSTFIFTNSESSATGNGGDLTITVDQALSIVGGGQIRALTSSTRNGGNLTIHAGSLSIDGSAGLGVTGIFAESDGGTSSSAAGNAGDLSITVDQGLSVVGSGEIFDFAFFGNGGDVKIHAGSLLVDGSATPNQFTGISGGNPGVTGNAGDLTIIVDRALSVVGGGEIDSSNSFSGKGGNVTIHAGSLLIDSSFIFDQTQGSGNAGDLTITADQALSVVGGGQIAFQTFSSGKGGDLIIHAGSLSIDSSGRIAGDSFSATSAGNLTITVDRALSVVGGGDISAFTESSGTGGDVMVNAGNLTLGNGGSISAASFGSGAAGRVIINTAGPIKLSSASFISTSSDLSAAGAIELTSAGPIELKGHSKISASAGTNGGNIDITSPSLVYLLDSSITATAGTSGNGGTGGNITIDSLFIVLNNSLISANAAAGQGGNINLLSNFFFNSNSLITATGTTNNGTVNITAPQLDLGAELITLPSSLVDAERQLQERCTALLQGDFSSFISIGRGGTEPEPDELESGF
jgi:filamentous hemagglutinin family protein